MLVQAQQEVDKGTKIPTDPQQTPTIIQPTTSQPHRKQKTRKSRRNDTKLPQISVPTEVVANEAIYDEMCDSMERAATTATGSDSEQDRGIIRDAAAQTRSERVSKLSNNLALLRVNTLRSGEYRLKLTEFMELCTQLQLRVLALVTTKTNQALKIRSLKRKVKKLEKKARGCIQTGEKITDINADVEDTLIEETQGRNHHNLMFDIGVLDEQEVKVEMVVSTVKVTTTSATTTTVDELTLAQTLIGITAAKPKAVTTAATTTTTAVTRPKARGAKAKGKAKMVEPEKPLKKKDQIMIDEEVARNLEAQLQVELEEEERLVRKKEKEANKALIVKWDDVEAMIDADHELAERLQVKEQGELTIKERSKLFVELMNKRKKHFVRLRAEEKRRKPPNKSSKEESNAFDKTMSWIKSFVSMDSKVVKDKAEGSKTRAEGSSKRVREELESDKSKKQRLDEKVEAEVDNDQEEAEMKEYMKILSDDENTDREDLETLCKMVKAKYENTRPEEAYKRVLYGDLKVMFEPNIESEVWRNLQGYNVTVWKLFSSCGVHFVRFQNLYIFMLVEK
nr:hypothetical protein [Tanacetum cinerariifolium]